MYIWTTNHAIQHLETFETITFVRRKYSSSVDWLVVTFPKHTDFAEKILFLPQNLEFWGIPFSLSPKFSSRKQLTLGMKMDGCEKEIGGMG